MKEEKIETNRLGGRGSVIGARYTDTPAAVHALAAVVFKGEEKYDRYNWKKCPVEEHLNHALGHIYGYLLDAPNTEEELSHALCRMAMAYEVFNEERNANQSS